MSLYINYYYPNPPVLQDPSSNPTGPASGDLTGFYPNPSLSLTGVTSGTYGSSTQVGQFSVDGKGRILFAANIPIAVTTAQITDFTEAVQDALSLALTNTSDILLSYNDGANQITANLTNTGVTSNTYGSGSQIPVITVDSKGRITNVAATPVSTVAGAGGANETVQYNSGGVLDGSTNFVFSSSQNLLSVTGSPGATGNNFISANGIKIGNNTATATNAGAGSLRYNAGNIEVSNGTTWNSIAGSGSGITSLNTLTGTSQTFATGTSGIDFGIVSAGSTHTFNIPNSSATNRGLLTSTDWTTFNNKQPAGNYITALTGDVTASGPGSVSTTISNNVVTYAKFQQVAANSVLVNNTASTANVTELALANTQILGRGSTGNIAPISIGSGLSLSGTTLSSTGGVGTVTSVDVSGGTTGLTFTNVPITSSGTITMGGTLGVANGGSGLTTTPSNGQLLIGNGTGYTLATLTGTANQIIVSNGSGSITLSTPQDIATTSSPSFVAGIFTGNLGASGNTLSLANSIKLGNNAATAATAGAGSTRYNSGVLEYSDGANWLTLGVSGAGITSLNGLTSSSQTFATGTTGTDFDIVSSGSIHTFNIPNASSTNRGLLTSTDWTTFNGKGDMLLGTSQTVTASKTFNNNTLLLAGATSGTTTLIATAIAGSGTVTLPTSGTLYGTATASITSLQLATSLSDETGSGSLVFSNSPDLTTPNIGAATGTSVSVTGSLSSGVASSSAGTLVLRNATNAFTQTIRGTNPSASIVYDLPTTAPTVDQVLKASDPSAGVVTLAWTTPTSGTVTTASVVSANGFAGTVANATTTPDITLTTTITGMLKGNGTAISAATSGTDYSAGTSALTTGILKSTTGTGTLSIASAGSDYEVPLTFSTGLTRTANTITVNTSQNIVSLSNLTTNGFVKTSGGTGTLSVDTNTYLTSNQSITLSGDVTGTGTTSILSTISNNAVTYAKFQQVAANSVLVNNTTSAANVTELALVSSQLLGRGSTGNIAAISLGSGLSMSGTTLSSTGGGSGASNSFAVAQTSHGLVVGDVVRLSGATTYVKAQANTTANAEVAGIVSVVSDANNFTLTVSGLITGLTGLTAGEIHFLSDTVAGTLVTTAPSTIGSVSKPVIYADTTTSGIIENMRGVVISSPSSSGASLTQAITQASHGFIVGDLLYLNGATYTKAIATSAAAAEVVGMVSAVAGVNDFTLQFGGRITGLSGLTAGEVYFLSPTTAGTGTITEPTTAGQISKPVYIADSTTTAYLVTTMRGNLIGFNPSAVRTVTGTDTATTSDSVIRYDATSAAFTATLYTAVGNTGRKLTLTKIDSSANAITIDANGSQTINGALTMQLAAQYDRLTLISDGTNWIIESGLNSSSIVTGGGNGYGSTNTKIRRYTTLVQNIGSGITYTDSATLGTLFKINEPGLYSIYVNDGRADGSPHNHGVSRNSSQLTTNIEGVTAADVMIYAIATFNGVGSLTMRLNKDDEIRPHQQGTCTQTVDRAVAFRITKVGI